MADKKIEKTEETKSLFGALIFYPDNKKYHIKETDMKTGDTKVSVYSSEKERDQAFDKIIKS